MPSNEMVNMQSSIPLNITCTFNDILSHKHSCLTISLIPLIGCKARLDTKHFYIVCLHIRKPTTKLA